MTATARQTEYCMDRKGELYSRRSDGTLIRLSADEAERIARFNPEIALQREMRKRSGT